MRQGLKLESDSAFLSTVRGAVDAWRARGRRLELDPGLRLEGRTALVTGASRGLGRAIAMGLAARGAQVIAGCRSEPDAVAREIAEAAGARGRVEAMTADLADLRTVAQLCDALRDRRTRLDIVVLNAAVVPRSARRTAQGVELMFGVNYLAHALLVGRLLADGVITNGGAGPQPRIVAVSSDSHRTAPPIDFGRLEGDGQYGLTGVMRQYEYSKLCLQTWAAELARRADGVAVHAICPGPVATDLARESPAWVKPVLYPFMKLFFLPPGRAAEPVLYLCAAPELEGETGRYLHMTLQKEPAAAARDPERGRRLWAETSALIAGLA